MSIIISDLSYHYPNRHFLFEHLSFSIAHQRKAAMVGDNGSGKSTLLKLMAGDLQPAGGTVLTSSQPYYIPQLTGLCHKSVAEVLNVKDKLTALNAILNGSISQPDYDRLADDWTIETRCQTAFDQWQIAHIPLDAPMDSLSGGEKTKVFLAGIAIHTPEILLLDEPSNHLDEASRDLLYQYIRQSTATILVVSHDISLLNQLQTTYELSEHGIKLYGGNYAFYKEQKAIEINALCADIHAEEKALRAAGAKARKTAERKQKQETRGAKQQ
jgi:ATPase subunit of ABC transporter with duplicated ATPase domains